MPVTENILAMTESNSIATVRKVSACHLTAQLDPYKLNSVLSVMYFTATRP